MRITNRAIFALAASVLTIGVAAAPSAYAADSMKAGMHKPMKKHKGSMMKSDAMHKGDTAPKDAEPIQ
jgi:pentapeptide MXKDX repeat protein